MISWRIVAALAAAALLAVGAFLVERVRHDATRAAWASERAELAADHAREVARLETVAREVVVRYIPKVEYIRGETRTITKEVPVYVTEQDDRDCGALPDGFERLHDRAAGVHEASADSAAAGAYGASGHAEVPALVLSDVGRAIAGNYGACRETAERLTALQEWARQVARK